MHAASLGGALCAVMFVQYAAAQDSLNVTRFGQFLPNPFRYSGSWSYVAPGGSEYGLLGGYTGTHVVAIDDSANIHQVGFVPGPQSNWRELTVIGNHAFVVTEGSGAGAGMQVISLATLPDSVRLVTTYTSTFTRGHIIMRDVTVDSPYVYVSGSSTSGGVHILNVSNPTAPVQVGVYHPPYYIHDAHIRGNRLYASAGTMRQVDIVDISNKSNPVFLRSIQYPGSYTHSCWTTDDHRFLFVTDEQDGQLARVWNIENLNTIHEVSRYSANLQSLVHNPYIRGQFVFIAHNTEGLRVVDLADPYVPVEVGYYDTFIGPSGGFNGLWSACPYLPSGKILGGDRTGGLYIWRFNNTRAGRVYGGVRDSLTGFPIDSALVSILQTGRSARSNSTGMFRLGELPGTYTVMVSAGGYTSKTLDNIVLNGGDSLSILVDLRPIANAVREEEQPGGFALYQNYPNPFNPSTTIRFTIAGGTQHAVSLQVYDLLGLEVATLVNEMKAPGTYEITFDGSGLSSGVYICRLTSGMFSETKRFVLVR
jgi:choice-of-anchor B domain-containing protein